MRLLLDEWVVRNLKRDLVGHEVMTVVEAGYSGMKNGALLRAASGLTRLRDDLGWMELS